MTLPKLHSKEYYEHFNNLLSRGVLLEYKYVSKWRPMILRGIGKTIQPMTCWERNSAFEYRVLKEDCVVTKILIKRNKKLQQQINDNLIKIEELRK